MNNNIGVLFPHDEKKPSPKSDMELCQETCIVLSEIFWKTIAFSIQRFLQAGQILAGSNQKDA